MLEIRKLFSQVDVTYTAAGATDDGEPLRKVVVAAVVANPYAGKGFIEDLQPIIDASAELGTLLGTEAAKLLGAPVESYGKAGIAGINGEQEHVNAALTSVYGNAFRDAIGGGKAWITSVTKVGLAGDTIDVPTAFKDDVWVRSHYDATEVRVPDAPRPDELLIIGAVTNRGRINARVGGMSLAEAKEKGATA
ncbi:amino acid synthesis family protein [Georgenia sp. Z1344]|uniref:amino acid synthesis family protein n=1 Tax=Georgenia sp. Z1344 TaxID=3416706 RepID=UPI003CF7E55C